MSRRLVAVITLLLALFVSQYAQAYCPSDVGEWASDCEDRTGLRVTPVFCPAGAIVFELQQPGEDPIRVEVGALERGRETVGNFGVSAIGEFPDWTQVGSDIRVPFDGMLRCLAADDDLEIPEGELVPAGRANETHRDGTQPAGHRDATPGGPERPGLPWWPLFQALLVIGLFAGCASFVDRGRLIRVGLFLFGLAAASYAIGLALHPDAFLHQNGQGPWWINYALCLPNEYGPGYGELFKWVAAQSPGQPDLAVFALQGLLGALWPVWAWITVRGIGGDRWLATVAAIAVALDPVVGRVVHSESYFATMTSLLFPAAAVLAVGARFSPKWRWALPLATLAAGALIAQSARIHPLGWLPAAFLPFVVAVSDGKFRSRILQSFLVGIGIAIVVGLTSGQQMMDVMTSRIGQSWGPRLELDSMIKLARPVIWIGLYWSGFLLIFARRRIRAVTSGIILWALICTAAGTNLLGHSNSSIVAALMYLQLPVAIMLVAAGLRELTRTTLQRAVVATLVLICALMWHKSNWHRYSDFPTDVLEAEFVMEHRHLLPTYSSVFYLGQAGQQRVFLPLYGECSGDSPHAERGGFGQRPFRSGDYYLRSSLCFTEEGAPTCQEREAGWEFEVIATADLPAKASIGGLDYTSETVQVALLQALEPIAPSDSEPEPEVGSKTEPGVDPDPQPEGVSGTEPEPPLPDPDQDQDLVQDED